MFIKLQCLSVRVQSVHINASLKQPLVLASNDEKCTQKFMVMVFNFI